MTPKNLVTILTWVALLTYLHGAYVLHSGLMLLTIAGAYIAINVFFTKVMGVKSETVQDNTRTRDGSAGE